MAYIFFFICLALKAIIRVDEWNDDGHSMKLVWRRDQINKPLKLWFFMCVSMLDTHSMNKISLKTRSIKWAIKIMYVGQYFITQMK